MQFLTDENVAISVTQALRAAGYNVRDVKESKWQGVSE